jgi:hypothetical protein
MTEIKFARPEYGALADELARLARAFGHELAPGLRRDVARLASAIERIDRRIDEPSADGQRVARWRWVVRALEEPTPESLPFEAAQLRLPRELVEAAADLRALGASRGALGRVRRIVRAEARTSEALREARALNRYIRLVEHEGRLTAALALVVVGSACGAAFRRFFFRLAAPANLVDKLLDAKDDHARGEIVMAPGILLYTALFLALVRRGVMLLATAARPGLIAELALRYLRPAPT